MQISDKGGTVTIRLTQAEGRRLRDAAYIVSRIAANLPDDRRAAILRTGADAFLAAAHEFTPAQDLLDRQDAEAPPGSLPPAEDVAPVPDILKALGAAPPASDRVAIPFDQLEQETWYRCWNGTEDVTAKIINDGANLFWKTPDSKYLYIGSLEAIAKEDPGATPTVPTIVPIPFDQIDQGVWYRCWYEKLGRDIHARLVRDEAAAAYQIWWETSDGRYLRIDDLAAIAKEDPPQ